MLKQFWMVKLEIS